MLNEIYKNVESKMKKSVESLQTELTKLRTGRAHSSLLDHVVVPYYGKDTPLNQVAGITVSDARTLMVTPWEKNLLPVIEKAILTAELGLNPVSSGNGLRVPLPPLSEERRKDMIKIARAEAENARVAVRNVRRDALNSIKEQVKKKLASEDDERRAEVEIQKITDRNVKDIDKVLAAKEADLMEV